MTVDAVRRGGAAWHVEPTDVLAGLAMLPDNSISTVITSPPYWALRNYGVEGQIGLEPTITCYVKRMVDVFSEVRRVLHPMGVCLLNVGDSYAGSGRGPQGQGTATSSISTSYWSDPAHREGLPMRGQIPDANLKPKDACLIPFRLAIALQESGWWIRQPIIWSKPNPMPESVTDRCTTSHEYVFLMTKSGRYFWDADAIRTPQLTLGETHNGKSGYRDGHPNRQHIPSGWDSKDGAHDVIPEGRYERAYGYDHRELNPAGANARSVWEIATEAFPEAHFATYPTELVRRCVLAGSSEKGVCSECGAPWRRVTERAYRSEAIYTGNEDGRDTLGRGRNVTRMGDGVDIQTTGWQPTCKHDAPVLPSLVLDPFSGAGTTVMVALRLGRRGLGFELNPEYVEMSRKRIQQDAPLWNTVP